MINPWNMSCSCKLINENTVELTNVYREENDDVFFSEFKGLLSDIEYQSDCAVNVVILLSHNTPPHISAKIWNICEYSYGINAIMQYKGHDEQRLVN